MAVRDAVVTAERAQADTIASVAPRHRRSATNLVHYVELRRHDIRDLQADLAVLGVSSLGRAEPHVLASLDAVVRVLAALAGVPDPLTDGLAPPVAIEEGRELLETNAARLLGPSPDDRPTRIMVTLPTEAATDRDLMVGLLAAGMDVARINCASDDAAIWASMIANLREAERRVGRRCVVTMDLAGPKLRTGPIQPGPRVVHLSPDRDLLGRVVTPVALWLGAVDDAPPDAVAVPVRDRRWPGRRQPGERIELTDARGAHRGMVVTRVTDTGCVVEVADTTYLVTGTALRPVGDGADDLTFVGLVPAVEQALVVRPGDRLLVTRDLTPAVEPPPGSSAPLRIGCTLPEVFDHVEAGHRIVFDDGKIGGIVERVTADELEVVVTVARPRGTRLRAGKGINLPDTDLPTPALTAKDLDDLAFVLGHADVVDLSFVRRPADVRDLQRHMAAQGAADTGVVLKIETAAAFEQLPGLLLQALQSDRVGVMIARGDLAVEVGFERLAEVQEEILWLCEAAHVPVIWATQVLDAMARTGRPSRAEVTDAAMGERAECVMLNKGPHIAQTVASLADILTRMQDHQAKKRPLLRRLRAWEAFATGATGAAR